MPRGEDTLTSVLLQFAQSSPDKPFLEVWDERSDAVVHRVTAAELASHVLSVAVWLGHDVAPGARVALLAHNSVAYLSLSFGTMALGATAVHLNWRQPLATNRELLLGLRPCLLAASLPFHDDAQQLCAAPLDATCRLVCYSDPNAPPCALLPSS